MDSGGPFGFGEPPEEFGTGDPDESPRGWIHPDDRLWRHPSELGPGSSPSDRSRPPWPASRWGAVAFGVAGAAMVAGVAVAMTAGGGPTPGARAVDTSLVTTPAVSPASTTAPATSVGPAIVHVVDSAAASLVTLVATDGSAPVKRATGVVLPSRDLVATAASAVVADETLTVATSSGRKLTGIVSGIDTHAGVAVVQLPEPLTPATFADETVSPDQLAVAACRCGAGASGSTSSEPQVAVGMVRAVGTPATDDGGPALVDAIEAQMPLASGAWGAVLVDDGGGVLGILDGVRNDGGDTYGYFVPASLAVAVAEELGQSHAVHRGWLGVLCQDDDGVGASVTTVLPGSPAALAGMRPGDVVEAVDSHVVRSLAELQARLYTSAPGSQLQLTLLRDGAEDKAIVTLVSPPT